MDVLRGMSIVLVLALHATLMVSWHQVEPWPALVRLNQIFGPYRMPMLMLLSGLMLQRSLRKGWARYYWGKLDKVAYPLLVWAAITHLIMGSGFRLLDLRAYLGPYHLWFMLFLGIFYLIAPLLERLSTLLIVLTALAISWLSPDDSKYFERLFCLMAFFFAGHYLGQRSDLLARLTTGRVALLALPVALALSAYAVARNQDVSYGPLLFIPVMSGIVGLIVAARALAGQDYMKPLAFLGQHSLVFYVSHFPLIYLATDATLEVGLDLPLIWLISLATSLGVGTALAILSEESAIVRGLFQTPARTKIRPST